jgi:hypothetical protein
MSDIQDLANDLGRVQADLPRMVRQALTATALEAEAEAKRNATTRLRVRTGRLRASIQSSVDGDDNRIRVTLQAGDAEVPYARAQEFGATITPRSARFLAIPVGPALTSAGVSRYASPRDVPGLHFQRGTLQDAQGNVWYVLKRSVTIRGTRFLGDAVDKAVDSLPGRVTTGFRALVLRGA